MESSCLFEIIPTTKVMNIKSPNLEIVDSSEGSTEVKCLFRAVEGVNHGTIAYQALQSSFLGGRVSKGVGYCFMNDIIWIYSLQQRKILAKIHFPAPVSHRHHSCEQTEISGHALCANQ